MFDVLIPYRGDGGARDELYGWVTAWWKASFPAADIIVSDSGAESFHRGASRNAAYEASTTGVVVVADADTVPQMWAVQHAVHAVQMGAPWALPYGTERYYNLTERATRLVLGCNPITTELDEPSDDQAYEHKITSWAGCLIIPRSSWDAVGGYDERFRGWGYEDNAFVKALDTLAGEHARVPSFACHLWHPITPGTNFDQPDIEHNRTLYRAYERASGYPARMKEVLAG